MSLLIYDIEKVQIHFTLKLIQTITMFFSAQNVKFTPIVTLRKLIRFYAKTLHIANSNIDNTTTDCHIMTVKQIKFVNQGI